MKIHKIQLSSIRWILNASRMISRHPYKRLKSMEVNERSDSENEEMLDLQDEPSFQQSVKDH